MADLPEAPAAIGLVMSFLTLLFTVIVTLAGAPGAIWGVLLSLAVFLPLIFREYLARYNVNSNRSDTARSVLPTLAWLLVLKVRGCGCIYTDYWFRSGPSSSWVESEEVWVRKMDGARVKFVKHKRGLKRCHECGNHFNHLAERSYSRRGTESCWPEEELDLREKLHEPIVDESEDIRYQ